MKPTKLGFGLIVVLVIAVAFAGCSGTSQPPAAAPAGAPAGQPAGSGAAQQGSGAASSAASLIGGDQLFGGVSYNWVEYKTVSGSGGQKMTIYTKWTKQGKCTIRFEGAGAEELKGMMPAEMDCSATGAQGQGQQQSNPNTVDPQIKFTKVGTEVITVPAGTFTADKYTASFQGTTATYWFAGGKPLLKMTGGNAQGSTTMELNGWG